MLVASLFFSWAIANSLNDVLVRQFRKALELTRGEAGLVQSAFYFGYFVAALPAGWLMRRRGYKVGILVGLGLYAAGALLFWPAAEWRVFGLFLTALTIIAFGLACLETAANPYIAVLGDPASGAARLNLAQAFNGLGAVVGPAIGGLFILSGSEVGASRVMGPAELASYRMIEARAVQWPYLALAAFVLCLAMLIASARLPEIAEDANPGASDAGVAEALRHRHLVAAIVAQFFYVAAQVCIWSYFIDFAKEELPAVTERTVAFLLSTSIAMLMLGRFVGSALMRSVKPARMLALCAAVNVILCGAAMTTTGATSVAALWATSLFMSIMFPTIFALGIRDLGPATKIGSSLLIMSIVGGAVLPPLMGVIGDASGGVRPALIVPLACFLVVFWFGIVGWRLATRAGNRSPREGR